MLALALVVALLVVLASAAVAFRQARATTRAAERSLRALDALLDYAPIGVALLDRDLRFVRANQALNRISGRHAEDVLGRRLEETIDRPELWAVARSVIDTGEPIFDVDVSGVGVDGRPFNAVAGYYPVRARGAIIGVGVIVHDVTQAVRVEAERQELLERVTRLQRITGTLAAARSTEDVVHTVVEDIRVSTGARSATVVLIVDGHVRIAGTAGLTPEVGSWWRSASKERRTPFTEAVRTGRMVFATSEQIEAAWPDVAGLLPAKQAMAVLPLLDAGEPQGAVVLNFDRPIAFDEGDRGFLGAVATQCSEALRRAQLHESEEVAHAASQAAAARMAYLAEASDALASSLDWKVTLRRVAELAVPRLADFAAAFVVEDDEIAAIEMASGDDRRETVRQLMRRWPGNLGEGAGLGTLARNGQPVLMSDLRPDLMRDGAPEELHAEGLLAAAGFQSLIAVPMRSRDRLVGMIVLATDRPRRLTNEDLVLATELATRAGQAIVNAELFRERSNVAATLQASLLPPATPAVPGLEVATRFFAVGEGIDVGGDFYDVFRMGTTVAPDNRWAVVIGDVRGKGTEAASISGAARHAIRAAALHERSPAAILRQLNELLLVTADDDDDEPRFCTAVVAAVEPGREGARITLAVGGHPAPMVLRADGTTEAVGGSGSLLGVLDDPELSDLDVELRAGDALVLYTDGVTERHSGSRFFDEDGLASVLSRCTGFTAPVLAERIETASRAFLEDLPRDDLAVVVVRAPEPVASASAASTDLPTDLTAPLLGRRFVVAALGALGFDTQSETAALLASELVTNALLHAVGPYRIAVETGEGVLRVGVSDGTSAGPQVRAHDHHETSGRGMRLVENLADRWGVHLGDGGKTVWFELEV